MLVPSLGATELGIGAASVIFPATRDKELLARKVAVK